MRKIRNIIYGREQGQKIPSIVGIFCLCFICPIFNTVLRFCRFSLYFYQYNEIMINIPDNREAAADTMEIMKNYASGLNGVIHYYSYSKEMALEYIKMGFYIGVGGVVTFKNARKLKEVVEAIPLESILLETDCPYLAPEPYRGKRNSSLYLSYVADEIARLKGITREEVVRQTEANAREMYRIW